MIEERHFINIYSDVTTARKEKVNLKWTPEELAIDMVVVVNQLTKDLEKYLDKEMKAPAKRVRLDTKVLETLGKSFRVQSIKCRNKNHK
jgi:Histone H1-like protein Hc1